MHASLSSNIWKYTLLLIENKRIFTAILGVYYLTIPGVTPFWIGVFLLVGNGASLVFDIPSSYIADRIGHKKAIVLSRFFILTATVCFLYATSLGWLITASIFLSMGFAFLSGVGNAFIHETLRGLGREEEYAAVSGKMNSIGFFIPAVLAAIVPFTVGISYKIPFLISLVFDIASIIVAFSLVSPPVRESAVKDRGVSYVTVVRDGFALRFFRIALFSGIVSALVFAFDGFRGPYQLLVGVPVIWFGVLFGIGRSIAALMMAYTGAMHRILGTVYTYQRLQIVIYGLLLLTAALTSTPWVIAVIFVLDNALRWGTQQLEVAYQLDIIRNHPYKATLLSTGSQFQNVCSMVAVFLLGYSIEHLGYPHSFLILAVAFVVTLTVLHGWIVRNRVTSAHGTN